jgi:hypothetical protein
MRLFANAKDAQIAPIPIIGLALLRNLCFTLDKHLSQLVAAANIIMIWLNSVAGMFLHDEVYCWQ